MSTFTRSILAVIAVLAFFAGIFSAQLCFEYYFGSGYGLIGWLSVPMTLLFAHVFATAGAAASTGRFPFDR